MLTTLKSVSADITYGYSTLPNTVNNYVKKNNSEYQIYSDSNNRESPYLQIIATDGLTPSWQLRGRLQYKSNDIVHVDLFRPKLQSGLKNMPRTYGDLISGDSTNITANAKDSSGEYLFYWPNTLIQILTTHVVTYSEVQIIWIIQTAATR